jgi:general secretion pathway protein D
MTFSDFCKALAGTVASGGVLLVATAPVSVQSVAWAQVSATPPNGATRNPRVQGNDEARITLNFQDADITQVIDAVQMATHKSIIIDPRVRAQVNMRSSTPVTPEGFYQIFLSILAVHGFIAVPGANGIIKIVPDANQRFYPGPDDLQDHVSATSDEIVTQVIPVKNVSATQLVTVLRPLVPTTGQINAYAPANMLIISDHASNVNRIMKIISRIDQVGDADVEVVTMQNASAIEVVRELTTLSQGQGQQDPGITPLKMVADERSNTVLISGEPAARLRAKVLITHLDTPQQSGGDTQVRYLRYADSDKLAAKLKEQLSGVAAAATGAAGGSGAATPSAQESKNSQIWSDPTNNALVITAPPKVMRQINAIIDKLDIRHAQVLVEAIIVDVDLSKSAELGVNWATWSESSSGTTIPGATFLTPVGGASLVDLANAIASPSTINSALESGTTVALGRVAKTGISFAAMLRALRSDTDTNVIATPSALTMDHQEATMKAVDEVPFVTGQYTNTGTSGGSVSPFQTIQNEEVGTILKVTPQINEGDAIVLKIDIESSSVLPTASTTSSVNPTTSKREISTDVLIEDGGIIVIGGLISNEYDHTNTSVPFLGSIPILGNLFKDHSATLTKSNLMVFIRPQIEHDGTDMAIETNSKYNFIREEQRKLGADAPKGEVPVLPGVKPPMLPPIPPPPPPGSTPTAPITELERARAAEKAQRELDAAAATAAAASPASATGSAPQVPK